MPPRSARRAARRRGLRPGRDRRPGRAPSRPALATCRTATARLPGAVPAIAPMSWRRPRRPACPQPGGARHMDVRTRIERALEEARGGTIELVAGVDDVRLAELQDPIMSPLLWDYGHIGVYEELWLADGV